MSFEISPMDEHNKKLLANVKPDIGRIPNQITPITLWSLAPEQRA